MAYTQEWLIQDASKHCKSCGLVLPISSFSIDRRSKDSLRIYCKACDSKRKIEDYNDLKNAVILKYGNECANCGFDYTPCLHLHHRNGRDGSDRAGNAYYRDLNRAPRRDDLILLCTLCHAAIHQPEPSCYQLLEVARRMTGIIDLVQKRKLQNALQEAIRIQCLKKKM